MDIMAKVLVDGLPYVQVRLAAAIPFFMKSASDAATKAVLLETLLSVRVNPPAGHGGQSLAESVQGLNAPAGPVPQQTIRKKTTQTTTGRNRFAPPSRHQPIRSSNPLSEDSNSSQCPVKKVWIPKGHQTLRRRRNSSEFLRPATVEKHPEDEKTARLSGHTFFT
jgi:hypothetical protein